MKYESLRRRKLAIDMILTDSNTTIVYEDLDNRGIAGPESYHAVITRIIHQVIILTLSVDEEIKSNFLVWVPSNATSWPSNQG
jgi:hypothetical protein